LTTVEPEIATTVEPETVTTRKTEFVTAKGTAEDDFDDQDDLKMIANKSMEHVIDQDPASNSKNSGVEACQERRFPAHTSIAAHTRRPVKAASRKDGISPEIAHASKHTNSGVPKHTNSRPGRTTRRKKWTRRSWLTMSPTNYLCKLDQQML